MVTFDSPLQRCEKCGMYVLMDQSVDECADEHHCEAKDCSLAKYFEGVSILQTTPSPAGRMGRTPRKS